MLNLESQQTENVALAWKIADVAFQTQVSLLDMQKKMTIITIEQYSDNIEAIIRKYNETSARLLFGITCDDINQTIKEVVHEANRVLKTLNPSDEKAKILAHYAREAELSLLEK